MELSSLIEVFKNRLIRIPDYQRGYSWEEKHNEALWNDIDNISEPNLHFLGVIKFQNVNNTERKKFEEEYGNFQNRFYTTESDESFFKTENEDCKLNYIVDGQQRITSLMILFKVISERYASLDLHQQAKEIEDTFLFSGEVNKFGYSANIPCYNWYKGHILNMEDFKNIEQPTFYTNCLNEAKLFYFKKIKLLYKYNLDEFCKKLTNYTKLKIYELDKQLDVSLVFETENNRGKSLSNLEILKNRLIYLVKINNLQFDNNNLHEVIINTWKIIYEYLGKNQNKILDDDEFLRAHWIMYFDHSNRIGDENFKKHREHLFDETFIKKNHNINGQFIFDYCKCLEKSVVYWEKIKNNSFVDSWTNEISNWISKIYRIPNNYGSFFDPLILAAFYHWYNDEDSQILIELLQAIERHNFVIYLIYQHKSNQNKPHYRRKANELFKLKSHISSITLEIKSKASENTNNRIKEFIHHITIRNDPKNMIFKREDQEKKSYFWAWDAIKYFFIEYELSLNPNLIIDEKSFKTLYVGPIYNSTSKNNWGMQFEKYNDGKDISETFQTRLKNTLGNLVLYKNIVINNKDIQKDDKLKVDKKIIMINDFNFEQRCRFDTKTRYGQNGIIGLSVGLENEKEVAKYDYWYPSCIVKRGRLLFEFLKKRWDININDDNKKQILLPGFPNDLAKLD